MIRSPEGAETLEGEGLNYPNPASHPSSGVTAHFPQQTKTHTRAMTNLGTPGGGRVKDDV